MASAAIAERSAKGKSRPIARAAAAMRDTLQEDQPELQLQRLLGNQHVSQVIQARRIQREPDENAMDPYYIEGGHYDAKEKLKARQHPGGLLLTASVIGDEERKLRARAPYPITVNKEKMRFGGGKLGEFVNDYNDFTHYTDEVLIGIGRLRDLLSAGAPEEPGEMTAAQLRALRPTDNTQGATLKKQSYREWRAAQNLYATSQETSSGSVLGGAVFDVTTTGRKLDLARQEFWQAKGKMSRTIEEAKRLSGNKPEFNLDIKFGDIVGLATSALTAVATGGASVVIGAAAGGADMIQGARKAREDYDKKMIEFGALIKGANQEMRDDFEAFKGASTAYWLMAAEYQKALQARESSRLEARQRAALLGQSIADPSEKRDSVLAEVRMPVMVTDAWHALAIIGPAARAKLREVMRGENVIVAASKQDWHWRADPGRLQDISQIRDAWYRTKSWEPLLAKDQVEWWVDTDKLWKETFDKFNV